MKTLPFLMLAACAFAQQAPTVARVFEGPIRTAESEVVPLVEAMPEEKFGFAPKDGTFAGVRTFAQQATHIATVNYIMAAAMKGEKSPFDPGKDENGPANIRTKAEIVKYVKDSFAYARSAAASLTAENMMQMMKAPFPPGQQPKSGIISGVAWHSFDHYGQMVVYARMNGVVPPASQPQPPAKK